MRLVTTTLVAIALALAGPVGGSHCSDPSTSEPEVSFERYYVDNDLCQIECIFSVWLYEESNGIEGLQRGDEVVDDTCHAMVESDTWMW